MIQSKQQAETLADRLPYFGFDPKSDAIWLKDGSATLSLKIVPKDCSRLTDEQLENLRAGMVPILNHLPEGSVLQALLMRTRTTSGDDEAFQRWLKSHTNSDAAEASPERVLLFNAKKEMLMEDFAAGRFFQTRCYLTLRVLPELNPTPGKAMGVFSHLAYWFQGKKATLRTRDRILSDLATAYETLSVGLSALGFEVAPVPHEERKQIIYEWLNPERSKAMPTPLKDALMPMSDELGLTDLVERKTGVALGRTELEIGSLKSLPEVSIPAAMQELACSSIPFSTLLTVYVLPQTQERERLLRKQRLAQGMASGNAVRNLLAEAQLRDIEDTLGALISSGEKLFGVSFHIVGIKESN